MLSKHAAKNEEKCPPGQRTGSLNWSRVPDRSRKICKEEEENKPKTEVKNVKFSTAGGANSLFLFYSYLPPAKEKKKKKLTQNEREKSPSTCFLRRDGESKGG